MSTTDPTPEPMPDPHALWYAFGYNDHRPAGAAYVDPFDFATRYAARVAEHGTYTPSISDAFRSYRTAAAVHAAALELAADAARLELEQDAGR